MLTVWIVFCDSGTCHCFQVFREIKVKDFDFSKFTTEQVFYTSKDGTKVPMFIVHKKVGTLWSPVELQSKDIKSGD